MECQESPCPGLAAWSEPSLSATVGLMGCHQAHLVRPRLAGLEGLWVDAAGGHQAEEALLTIPSAAMHRRKCGCNRNTSGISLSAEGIRCPPHQVLLGKVPRAQRPSTPSATGPHGAPRESSKHKIHGVQCTLSILDRLHGPPPSYPHFSPSGHIALSSSIRWLDSADDTLQHCSTPALSRLYQERVLLSFQ